MNKNIFIIDQSEPCRKLLDAFLSSLLYNLECFENKEISLKVIQTNKPDLIILTIEKNYSFTDYKEYINVISALKIPIFLITSFADKKNLKKIIKLEAAKYFLKSIKLERLKYEIELIMLSKY